MAEYENALSDLQDIVVFARTLKARYKIPSKLTDALKDVDVPKADITNELHKMKQDLEKLNAVLYNSAGFLTAKTTNGQWKPQGEDQTKILPLWRPFWESATASATALITRLSKVDPPTKEYKNLLAFPTAEYFDRATVDAMMQDYCELTRVVEAIQHVVNFDILRGWALLKDDDMFMSQSERWLRLHFNRWQAIKEPIELYKVEEEIAFVYYGKLKESLRDLCSEVYEEVIIKVGRATRHDIFAVAWFRWALTKSKEDNDWVNPETEEVRVAELNSRKMEFHSKIDRIETQIKEVLNYALRSGTDVKSLHQETSEFFATKVKDWQLAPFAPYMIHQYIQKLLEKLLVNDVLKPRCLAASFRK